MNEYNANRALQQTAKVMVRSKADTERRAQAETEKLETLRRLGV